MTSPNYTTHTYKYTELSSDELDGPLETVIPLLQQYLDDFGEGTRIEVKHEREYGCCGDDGYCSIGIQIYNWIPKSEEQQAEELAAAQQAKKDAAAKRREYAKNRKIKEAAKAEKAEAKKRKEATDYLKAHPELLEELKD